ncbi:hypothetical protein DMR34_31085, partial [Klebsiella variicola]
MSQLIQNIKLKQQQKKQQELQEQEILKKLISNNNLLIRDLKKLEENNSNSESRLIQLKEDLEYVEDLYTQLFLLLEDTYERFQHIQGRMNTGKNSKKDEKSKKKNSKSKIREVTTEDDINHIK